MIMLSVVLGGYFTSADAATSDTYNAHHKCSKKYKKCHKSKKPCKTYVITQRMVDKGLVIRKSGVNEFCADIVFSPNVFPPATSVQNKVDPEQTIAEVDQYVAKHGANYRNIQSLAQSKIGSKQSTTTTSQLAAITIASDDVYIDMKNFKLEQGDTSPGAVGFWLQPGYENISIVNGTVREFQGAGIASFIELSSIDVGAITDVVGDGTFVTYTYAPAAGAPTLVPGDYVNVTGVNPGRYNGTSFFVVSATATSFIVADTAIGIYVSGGQVTVNDPEEQKYLKNLRFENLTLIDNCPNGVANGAKDSTGLSLDCYVPNGNFRYLDTFVYSNVQIENCRINHNGLSGLLCKNIDNINIQNTQVNDTYAEQARSTVLGFALRSSRNIKVLDSDFNNTNNGISQPNISFVMGSLQSTNRDGVFSGCQFNGTSAVGTLPNPNFGILFCAGIFGNQQKILYMKIVNLMG